MSDYAQLTDRQLVPVARYPSQRSVAATMDPWSQWNIYGCIMVSSILTAYPSRRSPGF
jgi:hypothetical protein